eukprot:4302087-Pyramimonas_sp.AAC.1
MVVDVHWERKKRARVSPCLARLKSPRIVIGGRGWRHDDDDDDDEDDDDDDVDDDAHVVGNAVMSR